MLRWFASKVFISERSLAIWNSFQIAASKMAYENSVIANEMMAGSAPTMKMLLKDSIGGGGENFTRVRRYARVHGKRRLETVS
jgi:hypothetical protein